MTAHQDSTPPVNAGTPQTIAPPVRDHRTAVWWLAGAAVLVVVGLTGWRMATPAAVAGTPAASAPAAAQSGYAATAMAAAGKTGTAPAAEVAVAEPADPAVPGRP